MLVLCFACNHCPVAVAYEDLFIEFFKAYKSKGAEFLAINVNNLEADKLPAMKARAEEKGFNFPYLYDPNAPKNRGSLLALLHRGPRFAQGLTNRQGFAVGTGLAPVRDLLCCIVPNRLFGGVEGRRAVRWKVGGFHVESCH